MSVGHTEGRLMALAERLLKATSEGNVVWTVADESNTSFKATRHAGSVVIESTDQDGAYPFSLSVFDPNGRKVETLNTQWYDSEFAPESEPAEWNTLWKSLYE